MVAVSVGVTAGVAAVVTAVGLVVNHVVPESYMVRAVTASPAAAFVVSCNDWLVGLCADAVLWGVACAQDEIFHVPQAQAYCDGNYSGQ